MSKRRVIIATHEMFGSRKSKLDMSPLPQDSSWNKDCLQQKVREDERNNQSLKERNLRLENTQQVLKKRNNELELRAQELQVANLKLENSQRCLDRKIQGLAESLSESEGNVKELHKMIISSGIDGPGPVDDDVVLSFSQLFFHIKQVAIKYCRGCEVKDEAYQKLCLSNRCLWVAAAIADRLYSELFHSNVPLFGFTRDANRFLARLEEEFFQSKNVPIEDILDWRARTLKIAQLYDPELEFARTVLNEVSDNICSELFQNIDHCEMGHGARQQEIKTAMVRICEQAYDIAFLLRKSKVSYRWLQGEDPNRLNESEREIVGSEGGEGLGVPARIVFGGVVKGQCYNGQAQENVLVLRKSDVLLGPF